MNYWQMFSPQAVLFHLHRESAPLWINPAGPTWGKKVCSQASMWLLARRSRQVSPRFGRFGITDQSQSRRGIRPSWWAVQQWTMRNACWLDVTFDPCASCKALFIHRQPYYKIWNLVQIPFQQRCIPDSRCQQLWSSIYSPGGFLVLCTKVLPPEKYHRSSLYLGKHFFSGRN